MAGASKALHKYLKTVDEANAALTQRWRTVTHHLRAGLSAPVVTSAILLGTYEAPKDYIGDDAKKHRKPIRALYGFGDQARERFQRDSALYERYCSDLKAEIDTANLSVAHWLSYSLVLPNGPPVDLPNTAGLRCLLSQWVLSGRASPRHRAICPRHTSSSSV